MKPSILVVDDDEKIRHLLTDYFESENYRVEAVQNLQSAVDSLKKSRIPDILILDVMLPDGNGVEFLRKLRTIPKTQSLPVVLITAHFLKARDKAVAFELGADDYLTKPFDLIELKSRVNRHIFKNKTAVKSQGPQAGEAQDSAARATEVLSGIFEKPKPQSPPPVAKEPEPTPTNAEQEESESFKSLLKQYFQFFLTPRDFILVKKQKINLKFFYFVIGLFSAGMGLQSGIQSGSFGVGITSFIGYGLLSILISSFFAWIIQWVLGLKQKRVLFKDLFCVFSSLWVPLSYSGLFGVLYVLFGNGKAGDFTTGPLLLFPNQTNSLLGFILRRLDPFEIWGVYLVYLMMIRLLKLKSKKARVWVFGVWFAIVLVAGFIMEFLR